MNKFLIKTLFASALTLCAGAANAAAFQLQEVTTSGLGRAYAGEAAIADNAGVVATNPALMTQFKRPEISMGGIWVNPGVNIEGDIGVPAVGYRRVDAGYSDAISSKFLPNAYWIYPIDEKFSVGGGANVNYGLATEYNADYNAGLMGGTTDLTTINLNLSGAYRLDEHWSFGLGLDVVYAEAKLSRRVGGLAPLLNARLKMAGRSETILPTDFVTDLKGDDWGIGYNAGATYQINPNHRFGLAYHSKVKIKFDGTIENDLPAGLGGLTKHDGSVELNLPDYWEFSGYHQLTSNWAIHYSYKLTKWSRVQRLQAYTDSGVQVFDKTEHFGDTSRVAFGTTYDVNDKLTLRAGIAHDEGAAGRKSSISIPDTHRMWYSLGATYRFTPDLSVDLAYAYVHGKTRTFTEVENVRGISVEGRYKVRSQVNLYGLNLNYRF
ncbi:outer membrane protein transport protein [Exercitatus varius]|uniref:outer membrane protein transport protein n=1 Tax=Exercitatus varius TaxID=67857 RepID=UPI00294B92D7|nr:outer membrane protein transport protein [Exercitatus varius]